MTNRSVKRTRWSLSGLLAAAGLCANLVISCGDNSGEADSVLWVCQPGMLQACMGPDNCAGQARCADNGSGLGACQCGDVLADGGILPGAGGSGGENAAGAGAGGANGGAAATVDGSLPMTDGGMDPASCEDECDATLPSNCVEGVLDTCFADPLSGCNVAFVLDCAHGACADENHCAQCVNECTGVGVTGCAQGQLGSCVRDEQGCLKWEATQDCAGGFCADDQDCGTCDHECAATGDVECQTGESRVCAEDSHGCRFWWPWSECPTLQCSSATQCWIGYSVGQRGTPKNDEALGLLIDEGGAAATVGAYHSYGVNDYRQDTDAYLQVRDATDMLVKDAVWGSPADDAAMAVAVDHEGNHLVVGWASGQLASNPHHGGRDAFLAKWGEDELEPLWVRQWGSVDHDTARAVAVDAAGSVFVVGSTLGELGDAQVGGEDLFITKWDAAGNKVWSEQWGTAETDVASAAAVDAAGHLWIAGRTAGDLEGEPSVGGYDAFLAELDTDGQVMQVLQFGTTSGDAAYSLVLDGGNIWVAGITQGDLNGEANSGGIDSFVVKLDSDLSPIWTRLWGTTSEDLAAGLALDESGGAYLGVTVQATADLACDPGQIWAVGWDTDGVSTISESWDSCGAEAATGIAVRPDGQVQLVGWTQGDLVNESRGGKDIVSITLQP